MCFKNIPIRSDVALMFHFQMISLLFTIHLGQHPLFFLLNHTLVCLFVAQRILGRSTCQSPGPASDWFSVGNVFCGGPSRASKTRLPGFIRPPFLLDSPFLLHRCSDDTTQRAEEAKSRNEAYQCF